MTVNIFRLFRSKKRTGRGNQKCLKNWKSNILHLCFSCISYLSFGTEITGDTKTQPCLIDLNQQQRTRSIYRLHCFAGQWITCPPSTAKANIQCKFNIERFSQGGGSCFLYILLNEIQTMFSQLAKRSARFLPADLCTDHAHYVKNHKSTVLRRNKSWQQLLVIAPNQYTAKPTPLAVLALQQQRIQYKYVSL